jgi:hypothetical protein
LVGRDGCWPRFDSAVCFAALLGTGENGRWLIAPKHPMLNVSRRYRSGTLVLETKFKTEVGSAAIVDFMPPGGGASLVRIVIGRSRRVEFHTDSVVRFNYRADRAMGQPTGRRDDRRDCRPGAVLRTSVALYGVDLKTAGEFADPHFKVRRVRPMLSMRLTAPKRSGANGAIGVRISVVGQKRSKGQLITLKAPTYAPTGGIATAAVDQSPTCGFSQRFAVLKAQHLLGRRGRVRHTGDGLATQANAGRAGSVSAGWKAIHHMGAAFDHPSSAPRDRRP